MAKWYRASCLWSRIPRICPWVKKNKGVLSNVGIPRSLRWRLALARPSVMYKEMGWSKSARPFMGSILFLCLPNVRPSWENSCILIASKNLHRHWPMVLLELPEAFHTWVSSNQLDIFCLEIFPKYIRNSVLGLNNFTEVFIFNFQVFLNNGPPRKKVNHLRDQSIPTYHILLMEVPDPRQGFGENLWKKRNGSIPLYNQTGNILNSISIALNNKPLVR